MTRPLIIDSFPFNNELDMLECRLTELYDAVDWFVLVEATRDHQDHRKPLHYADNTGRFLPWADKIVHVIIDEGLRKTKRPGLLHIFNEQRIKKEVADALARAGHELKARELDMKERVSEAQIKKIVGEAVQTGVQAAFSAMQAGAQVAMNPAIAPIADAIMMSAGSTGAEEPPGITALSFLPSFMPPAISKSLANGVPMGTS